MELRVRDSNMLVDEEFGRWLIPRMRAKLRVSAYKYNLARWDKYINDSKDIVKLYDKEYHITDIIFFASDNLICTGSNGDISIHFRNPVFVPGFDRLNLNVIVNTITYGTLDIKGCTLFKDMFNHFADNIDDYIGMYYRI